VANAATYEIVIDNNNTFVSPEASNTGAATNFTPGALADGTYYWRVRGKNSSLAPGSWSSARTVIIDTTPPALAPALVSPVDPATVTGMPTFSWGSVATAKNYILQYNTINDFSGSVLYSSNPMSVLSFKPLAGPTGTIYWRVGSVDAVGNAGPWSTPRTLNINAPTPATPTLTAPANGAKTADNTPTFTWNTVAYATSYDILVDNNSTFVSPEASNTGALTNFTPGALADGIYYWRVRASNVIGNSGWSSARSVIIDTIGPNAPQQNAPANSAVVRGMPSFSWLSASTAVMYQMRYSDVSDLSTVMYTSPAVKTLSYAPPTGDMGVLYWQVRAQDSVGNWGPWGTIRMVAILPIIPSAPALGSPLTGATLTANPLTFSWTTVVGGVTYQIQIDDNNTFNGPEYNDTAATTSRTPALTNGIYYWRVRALNVNSEPGPWSTVRTLVIAL
jgi:predicted phage tail protein